MAGAGPVDVLEHAVVPHHVLLLLLLPQLIQVVSAVLLTGRHALPAAVLKVVKSGNFTVGVCVGAR